MRSKVLVFKIGAREIGGSSPTYIIAEISANHCQEFDKAKQLVEVAKAAGADAVKVQTYTPETLTLKSSKEIFMHGEDSLWANQSLHSLYKRAYMPWEWQPRLKQVAYNLGLDFFSTAYDATAVDFLEELGVSVYKIASFELVDLPLLRRVAQTGKPIILSTGMATLAEIDEAVRTIHEAGKSKLALLKCTSAYPAPIEDVNLRTIPHLKETFKVPVGLSDHSIGIFVPVAAVALGACIVEKHLKLSEDQESPDSSFSIAPGEFKALVDAIRATEKALGEISYQIGEKEIESLKFRKSLFVVEDIEEGERFTEENIRSIRPSAGLHPRYLEVILGRNASRAISRGTPLQWDFVA